MDLRFSEEDGSASRAPLPEFARPPVVETSIGIQFEPLQGYHSLSAASFWETIRGQFPRVEEHAPVDAQFETFGPGDSQILAPKLQLLDSPPLPRFFFVAEDASELVQLQSDRLFVNWRAINPTAQYPRYAKVRALFADAADKLQSWATANAFGSILPTQAESVYINRIRLADADGAPCGLSLYFPWLSGLPGVTDSGGFSFRRRLLDATDEPVARLHFTLNYGTDAEQNREAVLSFHIRGRLRTPSINSALEMLDAQRSVIVRTFAEMTSRDAHNVWERTL